MVGLAPIHTFSVLAVPPVGASDTCNLGCRSLPYLGNRICGKRLKALISVLVEAMERRGYLQLDAAVKSGLLKISAATIDRRLEPVRRASGPARRRRWGVGSAIKQSVPVRTFADWGEPPPGYCEADLEHCGGTKEGGNYVHSLTLTESIAAGPDAPR